MRAQEAIHLAPTVKAPLAESRGGHSANGLIRDRAQVRVAVRRLEKQRRDHFHQALQDRIAVYAQPMVRGLVAVDREPTTSFMNLLSDQILHSRQV